MHRSVKASAAIIAVLVALALAPATTSAATTREHFRVRAYVLDFDPLIAGTPLTQARAWQDPASLQVDYLADVAAASGGVVTQRVARTTVIRDYPVKEGGFRFTEATYLGCLADSSAGYCDDPIDYGAVLATAFDQRLGSACQAIGKGRADEVWLWGGPWFGYAEWLAVEPDTLCPGVDRRFVVMGFNYERGEAEMLHDLGHRAEGLVQEGIGFEIWDRFDGQRSRYAQDFACPDAPDGTHPEVAEGIVHAGNDHFPPNAYCHYQYDRAHPVLSDADGWRDFPDVDVTPVLIDATTWGSTQRGFIVWWLGRMPRRSGTWEGISLDWWRYIYPARRPTDEA